MILPNRLLACAHYVRAGHTVTDVGTDHGLLACHLAQQGHAVIAADVNQKPLQQAQATIAKQGLCDRVRTCLSDGLTAIEPADAADVIIAGMGGELIFSLVFACPFLTSGQHRLILQPMTQVDYLRQALCGAGFVILDETALEENGHHYTILCVEYDGVCRDLSAVQAMVGCHLTKDDPNSKRYLAHQHWRLTQKLQGLLRATTPDLAQISDTQALIEALAPHLAKESL